MKILIVDDSRSIALMVSDMLRAEGHEPVVAANGLEGIQVIRTDATIDLVLLDWNMPVLDGPGFLDQRKNEKLIKAPVIMMTTENKPQFISKALEKGVSEYVMKPFTAEILLEKINLVKAA